MTATAPSSFNPVAFFSARTAASPRFASILLASIMVVEFCVLLLKAFKRPFWYDEFVTLHVSRLQPFSRLWQALHSGVDSMPPAYHIIVRLGSMLPGDAHVTLRLPSILGYLLSLLGVYWFARKRLPQWAALSAVVLMTLSPFREYAIEARSYALLVGFLAMAAVFWQRIGERPFMTPLFALFLALAVSVLPLAVVVISSFGIAELLRTLQSRRIRWGVWISCLLAACTLDLPFLLQFRHIYSKHFWSQPTASEVLTTYGFYLGLDYALAVVLILLFAMVASKSLLRALRRCEEVSQERDFSAPEIALIGALLLYPALMFVLMKLLGSGYTPRYGWPGILGLVWGSVYLLVRTARSGSSFTRLLIALLIVFAVLRVQDVRLLAGSTTIDSRWTKLVALSRDEPGIPVVVSGFSGYSLMLATDECPAELRPRLVSVVDADSAARLTGKDSVERNLALMAGFMPLRVEDMPPFLAAHQKFILSSTGTGDWFLESLVEKAYRLRLVSPNGDSLLFIAER